MKRIPQTTKRFRKDYTKLKKSGRYDIQKLNRVMEKLIDGEMLSPGYKDHPLQGQWKDYRDCHIEGDWVLIYRLEKNIITFCATDNHANLFE